MCKVSKQISIGVGDIHPDGQHFKIFCQFRQTKIGNKSAITTLILPKLHRIHGRIVVNACVKYREKMFIGVWDIHPDGPMLTYHQSKNFFFQNCKPYRTYHEMVKMVIIWPIYYLVSHMQGPTHTYLLPNTKISKNFNQNCNR